MYIQQYKEYNLARKYLITEINNALGKNYQVSDDNIVDIFWGDSDRTLQVKIKPDIQGDETTNTVIIIPEQEVKDIVAIYLGTNIDKFSIKKVGLDIIDFITISCE